MYSGGSRLRKIHRLYEGANFTGISFRPVLSCPPALPQFCDLFLGGSTFLAIGDRKCVPPAHVYPCEPSEHGNGVVPEVPGICALDQSLEEPLPRDDVLMVFFGEQCFERLKGSRQLILQSAVSFIR